jgi:Flp pilus assembly protein TadG
MRIQITKLISRTSAKKFLQQNVGGVAVEFVLLAPIVMMLFIVSIDFGSYLLKKQNLSSITRGAITIVANTPGFAVDQTTLNTYARSSLGTSARNIRVSVDIECRCNQVSGASCAVNCNGAPPATFLRATMSYDHNLLFPYPGLGSTVSISDTMDFRVQ